MAEECTSDVTVIGGGVIGLSSAYYLQQAGRSVTVVDQNTIGSGASFANAGYLCPSHFVPLAAPGMMKKGLRWMFHPESPFYIRPRLNLDLWKWLWAFRKHCTAEHVDRSKVHFYELLQKSLDMTTALVRDEELDCDFAQRGLLMLYAENAGLAGEAEAVAMANDLGYKAKMMTAEEISEKESPVRFSIAGGSYYEGDAHTDPYRFVTAMRKKLEGRGVRFVENEEIVSIETSGRRIASVTSASSSPSSSRSFDCSSRSAGRRFISKRYVLANGAWSPRLAKQLGFSVPVQAGKGYSLTLSNPNVLPSTPYILSEAKAAVTPLGGRVRYAGTLELSGVNLQINQRRVRGLLKSIPRYLPDFQMEASSKVEAWAGLRPVTPDGLPIIDHAPQENLVLATGHAMLGVSLALVTGKLVQELADEQATSVDIRPYRLDRF